MTVVPGERAREFLVDTNYITYSNHSESLVTNLAYDTQPGLQPSPLRLIEVPLPGDSGMLGNRCDIYSWVNSSGICTLIQALICTHVMFIHAKPQTWIQHSKCYLDSDHVNVSLNYCSSTVSVTVFPA